jgi:hypothetical protein
MFFESFIWNLIVWVVYWAGRYADLWSSRDQIYYGLTEGTRFWRDKDGLIDAKRNVIGSAVWFAIGVALYFFVTGGGWIFIAPLGAYSFVQCLLNVRVKAKNRQRQIRVLSALRDGLGPNLGLLATQNGKSFYELFQWVSTTEADPVEAASIVFNKLVALSQKPETEWFPA